MNESMYTGEDRRQTIVSPPNNVRYIMAVMFMMALGVMGIVAIVVARPDNKDNLIIIGLLLGFLAPTTVSLLAFMKAQETHLSVNSRLDAFMAQARLASRAEGLSEGRKEGRNEANQRTDNLASGNILTSREPLDPLINIEKNTKETADTLKQIREK